MKVLKEQGKDLCGAVTDDRKIILLFQNAVGTSLQMMPLLVVTVTRGMHIIFSLTFSSSCA
jgi:hypothetical protein